MLLLQLLGISWLNYSIILALSNKCSMVKLKGFFRVEALSESILTITFLNCESSNVIFRL